jgi:hypothetical protein
LGIGAADNCVVRGGGILIWCFQLFLIVHSTVVTSPPTKTYKKYRVDKKQMMCAKLEARTRRNKRLRLEALIYRKKISGIPSGRLIIYVDEMQSRGE